MKKPVIITTIVVLAVGVLGYFGWKYLTDEDGDSKETVYVTSVETLTETSAGTQNRYAGVVEPQDTVEVKLENNRKVSEVKVKVGQEVKAGDVLFEYDLSSMEDDLTEAELEYDQLVNEANGLVEQINSYMKEQVKASQDQQLSYTIQIATAKMSLKKNEYNQNSKAVEIEKLKAAMNQTAVTSSIDGVIKKIDTSKMNTDSGDGQMGSDMYSGMMDSGSSDAFITILSTGAYRIKGKVNEQNYQNVVPGLPVIVRSRVDESKIWHGTMGTIDTESSSDGNNSMYYGMSGNSQTTSSSYNFYVDLDSSEDLMLGQHVYIEMDQGQEEQKDGLWLNDFYIVDQDTDPYVWGVAGDGDKLMMLPVILGDYDGNLGKYEILSGLTEEDYITFPTDRLEEGMPVMVTDDLQLMMESAYSADEDSEGQNPEEAGDGEFSDIPDPSELENSDLDGEMTDGEYIDGMDMGMPADGVEIDEMPADGIEMDEIPVDGTETGGMPGDGVTFDSTASDGAGMQEVPMDGDSMVPAAEPGEEVG